MAIHVHDKYERIIYNSLKKQTRCFHSVWMFENKHLANSVNIKSCVVKGVYESSTGL